MMNDKARLGFISAVLRIDLADIKETRILNTELRREHADDKLGIIDVHVSIYWRIRGTLCIPTGSNSM